MPHCDIKSMMITKPQSTYTAILNALFRAQLDQALAPYSTLCSYMDFLFCLK